MSDGDARAVFLELVRERRDAVDDPRRFSGLLADRYEGRWRREAAVLGAAVQEGVPEALRTGRGPFAAVAAPLAERLVDERGFDAALARWAVESWGIALGLTTERVGGAVQVASEPEGAAVELDGAPNRDAYRKSASPWLLGHSLMTKARLPFVNGPGSKDPTVVGKSKGVPAGWYCPAT